MNSQTEENYLKALFHLVRNKGEATINELSKALNIKMPTVNSMMKKFSEKKLVHYESYKPIRLTQKGEKEATLIIRKHRLTEMYLVENMGFGWEEVHHIAEQIEHIKSPEFFNRMDQLLGYPKIDPHGSPIPDAQGKMERPDFFKLSDCRKGDKIILEAVTHSGNDFLKFLNSRNLSLGLQLTVKDVESFDGSMTLAFTKNSTQTLSKMVCDKLLVSKINKR